MPDPHPRADRLGRIGIWTSAWTNLFRDADPEHTAAAIDAAAELDGLGYRTLWMGGSPAVTEAGTVLDATRQATVATGILSIWQHDAADVAAQRAELERRHPGRFLLGLGVSHGEITAGYRQPYTAMREYLSTLDSAVEPVPVTDRVLAALGPKMLALARDRAAGAHPYLVTADQIAQARAILGPDSLLAPEFKVVLDADLDRARTTARDYLHGYLAMTNYTTNLTRTGFTDDDFREGGSDRLLDAIFALGEVDAIADRVGALIAAGADHLALQVVTGNPRRDLPRAQWRRLATALLD
jgi:probable F420-dependent oxidoreductase